uniref:Uncharacterized protein n=1 Tax=Kwoniella bestiolae CBS 10118 TaxID=1296100 RepID=A0A1B9G0V7_9TREE|nr:hypothetical protein I302_06110 [Kwoniella bestiolae CBS 10118]OCF24649.1 hypothetical protein I302_06110 [Kwoniella bestiolae CBS 10118]
MGHHPTDKPISAPVPDPAHPPDYSGPSNQATTVEHTSCATEEPRNITRQPDDQPRMTFTNAPIVVDNGNLPNEGAFYCSICWGCSVINLPR